MSFLETPHFLMEAYCSIFKKVACVPVITDYCKDIPAYKDTSKEENSMKNFSDCL